MRSFRLCVLWISKWCPQMSRLNSPFPWVDLFLYYHRLRPINTFYRLHLNNGIHRTHKLTSFNQSQSSDPSWILTSDAFCMGTVSSRTWECSDLQYPGKSRNGYRRFSTMHNEKKVCPVLSRRQAAEKRRCQALRLQQQTMEYPVHWKARHQTHTLQSQMCFLAVSKFPMRHCSIFNRWTHNLRHTPWRKR